MSMPDKVGKIRSAREQLIERFVDHLEQSLQEEFDALLDVFAAPLGRRRLQRKPPAVAPPRKKRHLALVPAPVVERRLQADSTAARLRKIAEVLGDEFTTAQLVELATLRGIPLCKSNPQASVRDAMARSTFVPGGKRGTWRRSDAPAPESEPESEPPAPAPAPVVDTKVSRAALVAERARARTAAPVEEEPEVDDTPDEDAEIETPDVPLQGDPGDDDEAHAPPPTRADVTKKRRPPQRRGPIGSAGRKRIEHAETQRRKLGGTLDARVKRYTPAEIAQLEAQLRADGKLT